MARKRDHFCLHCLCRNVILLRDRSSLTPKSQQLLVPTVDHLSSWELAWTLLFHASQSIIMNCSAPSKLSADPNVQICEGEKPSSACRTISILQNWHFSITDWTWRVILWRTQSYPWHYSPRSLACPSTTDLGVVGAYLFWRGSEKVSLVVSENL